VEPVVAAGLLVFGTALVGAVALTAAPGSRRCRGSTWALSAASTLVSGILVAVLLLVRVPATAIALIAVCPLPVLGVATLQARGLQRRLEDTCTQLRQIQGRHPPL